MEEKLCYFKDGFHYSKVHSSIPSLNTCIDLSLN